jgi:sigma-B regulation protein RsbU (phosphoserine phosphatase)
VQQEIGGETHQWEYVDAGITYAIIVPGTWFAHELFGRGQRNVLHVLRMIGLVFVPIAVGGMFATANPEWIMWLNNLLILALLATGVTIAKGAALAATSAPAVRVGFLAATVFILAENLRSIRVLPWPGGVEYIGVTLFVASLAFAVADRFLRTESRLALVDRELATARRIQQAILPERVPTLERFRLAARYVSMNEVAGDFYDFLGATRSSVTVLVADVSGHGVPAALIASMVKVAAASHVTVGGDPGRLFSSSPRHASISMRHEMLHCSPARGIRLSSIGAPRTTVSWSCPATAC